MTNYCVVSNNDIASFTVRVESLLKEKWVLVGGVSFAGGTYFQAMAK